MIPTKLVWFRHHFGDSGDVKVVPTTLGWFRHHYGGDFQSRPGSSKKPKRETKVLKKDKQAAVIKEFPSLKNRCSPGSLLGVIQGLSREQKDCVRAMGFGSLLGMKMIDVPWKIFYYVLDHFNFESLKVEFDNCEVSVDSKFVQEMLGLPSGGSLLSNMDYISENNEESCMFE
ncbi:unnamed protein product [Lactuca virosa]|uniref:Uncharacterized protein n=1 Tax=Lactuca virosa TaxID=75947 RepID=A0AAU9P3R9_9ASTR|nr:unnamed protein product [Lactuca virosa]